MIPLPPPDTANSASRRFLRARKFEFTGALGQFSDTEKWRAANKIDALYEHMDVDSYESARVMVSILVVFFSVPRRTDTSVVPPMDRPSRPPWPPSLRLCHQASQRKEHVELLARSREESNYPSPYQVEDAQEDATSLRPVREHAAIRPTPDVVPRQAESRNTYHPGNEHCGYIRSWLEAILESERAHAGSKCTRHRPLPRDTGSKICMHSPNVSP